MKLEKNQVEKLDLKLEKNFFDLYFPSQMET